MEWLNSCLRLPECTVVMLRPAGGVTYEIEGQTLTIDVDKEWRFGHTSYLSGKVIERRIDGAVLAPKPLELYYRDTWNPKEEFAEVLRHRRSSPVPDWVSDLVKAGVRRARRSDAWLRWIHKTRSMPATS